jgi:putative ABC transport system permease protein
VAIYDDAQLVGDYVISMSVFDSNYTAQADFLVLVSVAAGTDIKQLQETLRGVTSSYPGVKVQNKDEYIGDVRKQINQFLSLITALLSLAIIIAVFGVLIAMLLAVFERTRELGLLRAVGMSRSQLRSMVRWEAAIISVFGALLGTALGLFFGFSLTKALGDQGIRRVIVPVPTLVYLVLLITLLGIGAALYPARRASRLDILTAVSSE